MEVSGGVEVVVFLVLVKIKVNRKFVKFFFYNEVFMDEDFFYSSDINRFFLFFFKFV